VCWVPSRRVLQEWELESPGQRLLWGILFHRLCWGFVFPSPSDEINTFTCQSPADGAWELCFCLLCPCRVAAPISLPTSQLAPVPPPIPLAEQDLGALLPGNLVALFPKDTVSLEGKNLVAVGHGAGPSLPCVAGSVEPDAWLEQWCRDKEHGRRAGPLQRHPQDSPLLSPWEPKHPPQLLG